MHRNSGLYKNSQSISVPDISMPVRDWKAALNFFLIQFEDRIEHVA
jgi:hypothetical protein